MFSLKKCLFKMFLNYVFLIEFLRSFIYCGAETLISDKACKCFLVFCGLSFHVLEHVFWCIEGFNLIKSNSFFSLFACAVGVIFKNPLPNPSPLRFTPMFSCKTFIVLALLIRSLGLF